ncbi:MAG: 3'-5' exonuclease domain-containing protein 2 [Prevotella sp.]|nr:3'-5' exonuclease domain-containing protein 2 [Prevotella sp.]
MKKLYVKMDASAIAAMPAVSFDGRIVVVDTLSAAEAAVECLLKETTLGIDTETRPTFRKGEVHNVSLLQVATNDVCYLFRLNRIGIPPSVLNLLTAKEVTLVGLSLVDDLMRLHNDVDFEPGHFVDLQKEIVRFGIEDRGLRKMYANFFSERISKREQLSNWEARQLSPRQQQYAAIDAWACLRLYDEFQRLWESGDYVVVGEEDAKG